jgi:hypothetical protein
MMLNTYRNSKRSYIKSLLSNRAINVLRSYGVLTILSAVFSILFFGTSVSAENTGVEKKFSTLSELINQISVNTKDKSLFSIQGHMSPTDLAGGKFLFQRQRPTEIRAGLVYEVPGMGFLIRQNFNSLTSPVRAEWFGAIGNGINDDGRAIQDAINNFNRVHLLAKVYGVGKGLVVTESKETKQLKLQQIPQHVYTSIFVKKNTILEGSGKHATLIRLLPGTNPRPENGNFSIIGSDANFNSSGILIQNLGIDANFDQQYKGRNAPDDIRVESKITYTLKNTEDVATLSAIRIIGPKLTVQNIFIKGYSSNGRQEAFVIYSSLRMKDTITGRECATIRNVEMTEPGSNLELKYRIYKGVENLRSNINYSNISEITHISVGGSLNYGNSQFLRAGQLTLPSKVLTPENVLKLNSIEEMRKTNLDILPKPDLNKSVVYVQSPGPVYLKWDRLSIQPTDNLNVFSDNSPLHKPVFKSLNEMPKGRFIRQRLNFKPGKWDTVVLIENETALDGFFQKNKSVDSKDTFYVLVERTSPAYFLVDKSFDRPSEDGISVFGSTVLNSNYVFARKVVTANPDSPVHCDGWGCDPGFDPSYLGENENNRWACTGGVIEDNYIHDEQSNPEGYTDSGERYGLTDPHDLEKTNASHLHGITLFETENMVVRNNRFKNFQGVAVFIMSWWNRNLTIESNVMEDVHTGIGLASFINKDTGKPQEWPRHMNYKITKNRITLKGNPKAGAWQGAPAGVQLHGDIRRDMAEYPNAIPEREYPRMSGIEISDNFISGTRFSHVGSQLALSDSLEADRLAKEQFERYKNAETNYYNLDQEAEANPTPENIAKAQKAKEIMDQAFAESNHLNRQSRKIADLAYIYPVGVFFKNTQYAKDIQINQNRFDIEPNHYWTTDLSRTLDTNDGGELESTAIRYKAGQNYSEPKYSYRQSVYIWGNRQASRNRNRDGSLNFSIVVKPALLHWNESLLKTGQEKQKPPTNP